MIRATLFALATLAGGALAAGHGGHDAAGASLLPACQGADALPSPHCGRVPTPAFDATGRLWVAFVQHGHVYLSHSDDRGAHFAPPRAVNAVPEAIYADGENRPKLAIGPDGTLHVSWTRRSEGRYAGDIRYARAPGTEAPFAAPLVVNADRAPISHRFDALIVDRAGRVAVAWIDKRDLARAEADGRPYDGAAIYLAVSEDGGASFAPDRRLADHSCECCRIALDLDAAGQVVALWRHVYPGQVRDHAIVRLDAQLRSTGTPTRATDDGWAIEGCPHHGPDLAIDAHGRAHMAWFTLGDKHRGLIYGRYDLARGRMESEAVLSDSPGAAHPQIAALGDGQLVALWKAFDGERTALVVRRSSDDGAHWSAPQTLADTAHDADHPQLLLRDGRPVATWHTQAEGLRVFALPATP